MKIDDAIEILTTMRETAAGQQAAALALAIGALEDALARHEAQVAEAEEMLGMLLDGAEGRDRATTWRFLRDKLTLPGDVLDEVERRLGLADEEGAR
ncbi:MAG TPA: hypothetical protein ENK20_03195 [Chromatiales bacterium]|nr:hypothetical protein [Chromatiales bacterium]